MCLHKPLNEMGAEYYKAFVAYAQMTNWGKYEANPECVKKMMHSEYWYAEEEKKKEDEEQESFGYLVFIGVAVGAAILVAIALILLFKCRKHSDDDDTAGESKLLTVPS